MILSFDSSTPMIEVAIQNGDQTLVHLTQEAKRNQGEILFPLIDRALSDVGIQKSDLTAIGVGIGPGNFTGIRLAVAAASGLSDALDIPAIGVSNLDALLFGQPSNARAIIDAKGGKIYLKTQNGEAELLASEGFETTDHVLIGEWPNAQSGHPTSVAIAKLAQSRMDQDQPMLEPLYLKSAAADLPSEPPITILP